MDHGAAVRVDYERDRGQARLSTDPSQATIRGRGGALLRLHESADRNDHEALVAVAADGTGVGVARFVRTDKPDTAETAVTVVDDWQGCGAGTVLLAMLSQVHSRDRRPR